MAIRARILIPVIHPGIPALLESAEQVFATGLAALLAGSANVVLSAP